MAYSSSFNRAQVQKLCDLCKTDPDIKWRCVQCNKFMCYKCKNIHLNVQTSVQHDIVDLKTDISDVQAKIITDNISCSKHGKNCCIFCRSCEIFVCPDCISSSHHSHRFEPIENVISGKVDELRGFETNIQTDLSRCQTKVNAIQSYKAKCYSFFDDTITTIQSREQNLKDAISKYSQQLQDDIKVERKSVKKSLSQIKKRIQQEEKNLVAKGDTIRTKLTSNQGKLLLEATSQLKYTSSGKFDPLPSETKQFSPGEDTASIIPGLFGHLKKSKLPEVQSDIDFEVVRTLTTNLLYINQLICVDETSAWISSSDDDVVRQIKIEQDNIKTTQEISVVEVYDMVITPNNDILLSVSNSSDIKLLTKTGAIKPFLSVSPLKTCGISVTSDNNVIVGVEEKDALYKTTDKSTRALFIFSMDGKQKKTYPYDKNIQRFTSPYRVTTNTVNDILVIDKTSNDTGRVVVLSREGGLKWTYEGHPEINNRRKFDPRGIVTTTSGNVIVSDYDVHALHVLSGEGHLLSCKVVADMGIEYPWALDIDRKGQLWVGCGTGFEMKDVEIHIVKLL